MKTILSKTILSVWVIMFYGFSYAQEDYSGTGTFMDTLKVAGNELRLAITIQKDETGIYRSTFNSIDQGSGEIAFDEVRVSGTHVFLSSLIGIVVEGDYNEDKSKIAGEFRQGAAKFPLEFERVEQVPTYSRPQEPVKPYPYIEEEVFYRTEPAGIGLAGTLTLPQGEGPFPAVVLLTGSGPQNRNEELLGHKPFLVIADFLTRHGIAVLRADDRGVGGSTGIFADATTGDFADDGLAGIEFLKTRSEINPAMIGFIGHSEGGMMAPVAASKSSEVAFIVLLAGPGANLGDNVTYQRILMAKRSGVSDEYARVLEKYLLAVNEIARKEIPDEEVKKEAMELYYGLSEADKRLLGLNEEGISSMAGFVSGKWWRYGLRFNPEEVISRVQCPVLALLGEKDQQVPVSLNLKNLEQAISNGNSKSRVVVMPGLNHLFQTCETGDGSE